MLKRWLIVSVLVAAFAIIAPAEAASYTNYNPTGYNYSSYSYNYTHPSYDYTRPSYSYTRPSYTYTRPTYNYSRPSYTYTRPSYDYARPYTPPQVDPVPTPTPTPTPPANGLSASEQRLVDLINQERTSRGLNSLKVDMRLVRLARKKSKDMIDNNYFGHQSPTYGGPSQMLRDAGISFFASAENIAGGIDLPGVHDRLMASEGHRLNLLDRDLTHVGVGMVAGGKWGGITTELFIDAQ